MAPTPLRIERPYDSVEAYLEGDGWTVDRTDMLLVGAGGLAAGTSVLFEIVLLGGVPMVRGEGRILEGVTAAGGRPGGLRVRFLKLDAPSKSVLRRALESQKQARPTGITPTATPTVTTTSLDAPAVAAPAPTGSVASSASEPSGVRHRSPEAVAAPQNRDALLGRLRERTRGIVKAEPAPPKRAVATDS